jgi:hypothetical protein
LVQFKARVDGAGDARMHILPQGTAGWDWGRVVYSGICAPATVGFVPAQAVVSAPEGCHRLRLRCQLDGSAVTAWFRDLSIVQVTPRIALPRLAELISVDGHPGEPAWMQAPLCGLFHKLGQGLAEAEPATLARLASDGHTLWLACRATEPDPAGLATGQAACGAPWDDDCLEVFLSADRRKYLHLIVTAAGVRWARWRGGDQDSTSWYPLATDLAPDPASWQAAVQVDAQEVRWEVAVSLDAILGNRGGEVPLFCNVARHRSRPAGAVWSSWALLPGQTYHVPRDFATVVVQRTPTPQAAAIPAAATLDFTTRLSVPVVLLAGAPVELAAGAGRFPLPGRWRIEAGPWPLAASVADLLADRATCSGGDEAVLRLVAGDPGAIPRLAGPEAFTLTLANRTATVLARERAGMLRGVASLILMASRAQATPGADLPALRLADGPAIADRGWYADAEGSLAQLKEKIDVAYLLRLNRIFIYLDAWNYARFPFAAIAATDAKDPPLPLAAWQEVFAYARDRGIDPIPHLSVYQGARWWLLRQAYAHLAAGSDPARNRGDRRSLDVANPEALAVALRLQQELVDALHPTGIAIGCDETHYSETISSAAARAKGWKPSDWLVAAITASADHLRSQGVAVYAWGDMLDPGQNGGHLDLSGPALLARLPRDLIVLDWKYEGSNDNALDYPSLRLFRQSGRRTIGCPWYKVANVVHMAESVRRYGADGICATTWSSSVPERFLPEFARSLALTAWAAWSPEETDPARMTGIPDAAEADARRRADPAPGPAARPLEAPAAALTAGPELMRVLGLPVDADPAFLRAPLRHPRGVVLQPFLSDGQPAALVAARQAGPAAVIATRGQTMRALTLLHTATPVQVSTSMPDNRKAFKDRAAGAYTVRYADGGSERITITYRHQVSAVNDPALGTAQDPVLFGTLSGSRFISIAATTWVNPHPRRPVAAIELEPAPAPEMALVLLAASLEP